MGVGTLHGDRSHKVRATIYDLEDFFERLFLSFLGLQVKLLNVLTQFFVEDSFERS